MVNIINITFKVYLNFHLKKIKELSQQDVYTYFKSEHRLDTSIWKSFGDAVRIPKKNLSVVQIDELNKIDILFEKKLSNFKFITNSGCFYKNKDGYTFKRICSVKDCSSNWILKVSVPAGDGILTKRSQCNHFS